MLMPPSFLPLSSPLLAQPTCADGGELNGVAVNGVQITVMFRDDATSSSLIDAVANRGGADRLIKHTQVGLHRG